MFHHHNLERHIFEGTGSFVIASRLLNHLTLDEPIWWNWIENYHGHSILFITCHHADIHVVIFLCPIFEHAKSAILHPCALIHHKLIFGVFRISHNVCPADCSFCLCIQPHILWAIYCTNRNWSPYFVDINWVLFHCGLQFLTELYLLLSSPNHQLDK